LTLPADALEVGEVVAPWGIRGGLKIVPAASDAPALLATKLWWLVPPSMGSVAAATTSYRVISSRKQAGVVVATLDGVADRNAAETLVKHRVFVPRSAFPKAAEDEFYWNDLLACAVVNREGAALGEVVGLIDTGVHSVLRVLDAATQVERLIPFVSAYVDRADVTTRRIEVDWPSDWGVDP
jgi:16S rRNA processing protein RimM